MQVVPNYIVINMAFFIKKNRIPIRLVTYFSNNEINFLSTILRTPETVYAIIIQVLD